jgi:hypothetical protein
LVLLRLLFPLYFADRREHYKTSVVLTSVGNYLPNFNLQLFAASVATRLGGRNFYGIEFCPSGKFKMIVVPLTTPEIMSRLPFISRARRLMLNTLLLPELFD